MPTNPNIRIKSHEVKTTMDKDADEREHPDEDGSRLDWIGFVRIGLGLDFDEIRYIKPIAWIWNSHIVLLIISALNLPSINPQPLYRSPGGP